MTEPSPITAEVIADSISESGSRLSTVVMTLPRSALAELNTHRAFSRNSASSRAVPVVRMIEYVRRNPFVPRAFSLHRAGMNAHHFVEPGDDRWETVLVWWLHCADLAVGQAQVGLDLGLHKQDINRILEPYLMHTVVVSATGWENFFAQRLALDEAGAPLAYLPIYDAALATRAALAASTPEPVPDGGWHLPFVAAEERSLSLTDQQALAAARCARVSYFTPTGDRVVGAGPSVQADLDLCHRLLHPAQGEAPHLSPFEHIATPDTAGSGNFEGWRQWRAEVEADWAEYPVR